MEKEEALAFIVKHPMCCLGTIEDDKARVRGMETFRADEKGLIFYTAKAKDVYKQIAKNPEVEVCYMGDIQVRVRGKMEILEDLTLKKEIVEKRPFLKPIFENKYEGLAVFRLKGKATTWSGNQGTKPGAPKTFIDL
jgi:pyridoxamine 5'-phosphate oxidase